VKFVKGRKAGAGEVAASAKRMVEKHKPSLEKLAVTLRPAKQTLNPWIDRRLFDLMEQRAVAAENMCRDLIRVIAVDDGEFLASHDFDYLAAGNAILKGDV
jgi:hypothetical protein